MAESRIRMMTAAESGSDFRVVVERVARNGERIEVQDQGVTVVGIVSAEDLKRLDQFEQEREADFAIVDKLRAAFANIAAEEIEREVDRALAANRAAKAAGIR